MKQHADEWPIEEMARVLGVSRSGYYKYRKRTPGKYKAENEILLKVIKSIYERSRQTYGSPRIHAELIQQGFNCSRKRVARLMKKAGIAAKMKRAFKRTTQVDSRRKAAPNLLQQEFSATMPNLKWAGDISYIGTKEGWLYIAVILDLFSRKVVGLAMSESMHTALIIKALEQALARRRPSGELQHHSDRGCQYTSEAFQALLDKHGIVCSMSGTGNCYDNAVVESFFHTLKTECVYFENYATREQAMKSIFEYVERFYNNQRRHSTLGYVTPAEFERRFYQQPHLAVST